MTASATSMPMFAFPLVDIYLFIHAFGRTDFSHHFANGWIFIQSVLTIIAMILWLKKRKLRGPG
jgi:hypothetical protein